MRFGVTASQSLKKTRKGGPLRFFFRANFKKVFPIGLSFTGYNQLNGEITGMYFQPSTTMRFGVTASQSLKKTPKGGPLRFFFQSNFKKVFPIGLSFTGYNL